MDVYEQAQGESRFVLLGICSGGTLSFMAACRDTRVVGAVMINARGYLEGADDVTRLARVRSALVRHYLRMALASSFTVKNWRKGLRGRIHLGGIWGGFRALLPGASSASAPVPAARDAAEDLRTLSKRGVRIYIIHSEADEGLDYLRVALGPIGTAVDGQRADRFRDHAWRESHPSPCCGVRIVCESSFSPGMRQTWQ